MFKKSCLFFVIVILFSSKGISSSYDPLRFNNFILGARGAKDDVVLILFDENKHEGIVSTFDMDTEREALAFIKALLSEVYFRNKDRVILAYLASVKIDENIKYDALLSVLKKLDWLKIIESYESQKLAIDLRNLKVFTDFSDDFNPGWRAGKWGYSNRTKVLDKEIEYSIVCNFNAY